MSRRRVAVPHHGVAAYDVVVEPGLLGRVAEEVRAAVPAAARLVVISDDRVAPLHGESVRAALEADGRRADLLTFPAGEANKTRAEWARLTDALLALGAGRDAAVVAVGGGVAGDLAGFVAATYMRGLPVVQVPTTLLAMVDASVGGKTGVDTPAGKNLVGAFHPPAAVLIDPETLATLPDAELRQGLAEAVKHGAIADAAYLEAITRDADRIFARDAAVLAALVARSVEIKAGFVEADPLEAGPRAALNFGHTVGHAVEALTGYRVAHGEAVAMGMVVEAALGEAAGISAGGTVDALATALAALGLPTAPPAGLAAEAVVERARADKKARAARVRYSLIERPGAVARGAAGEWTHAVDDALAREVIAACARWDGRDDVKS